jgi:ubiquinone/menaquinone biosynthesis C-methylase UbiE
MMTTSFAHDTSRLERLELKPGARVLDIGCGTGRLAHWVAEQLGPEGHVVGVDPLRERIALARERAGRFTFQVGQAGDLHAFDADSFDAAWMSAVFHWVSDKPKALAEIRRVLRPGGRFGATTMSRELTGASTITQVLIPVLQRSTYAERVNLSGIHALANRETLTETVNMIVASGLELAELHVGQRSRTHASGTEVVDFVEASSFGNFLRIVPADLRASFAADLAAAFEAQRGPEGIAVRDFGVLFVARKA